MNFQSISEAMDQGEGLVHIRGWIHRERGSKKLKFIVLRDSTHTIQCVLERTNFEDRWDEIDSIQIETSLEIEGVIKKDERAPTGFEVQVSEYSIIGASQEYPIGRDQSIEFLADNRHLWLRSSKMTAILKIRSTVIGAIHTFFRTRGFYEFSPPIFQPNQCEGGSTLFEVKYFEGTTFLTQSWQLYAEAAVFALEKIYDVSPTFRAEKSKTSRHLTEFWMAEMEAAWMNLHDATELAKEEIKFIVQKVLEDNVVDLQTLAVDIEKLKACVHTPFLTITYTEALEQLKTLGMNVEWGKDLRTIEEETLMKSYDVPLVVIDYPKEIMAFYKPARPGSTPLVAMCFDMLAPNGMEIIGGSQRETSLSALQTYLVAQGEKPEDYGWYLDLRKYGSVPHSGYGVGVERVIAWICGLESIKDAIPFPRTMGRKTP